MKLIRLTALFLAVAFLLTAQPPPKRKRLLAIGATQGFEHDATTQALATLWKLGQDSGLWDTYIRTDTELITKKTLKNNAKNLSYFDAVAFYTTGELPFDDEQKAALLSFVKDDGKGFIGVHSAPDTFYQWPEYGEMLGGYFDGHPWNTFQAPILVEDPTDPIVSHFPKAFTILDEIYQVKDFSRQKCRVLLRLDETKLDLSRPNVKRTDRDFAVAWIKEYGKGRVFYSTLGHTPESWNDPNVQKMWLQAVKYCMKLIDADATPRPRPAN
jgi:type 1 glutamine amidotransferase